MGRARTSTPPTRPRLLPAVPHPFALPHPIEVVAAGGRQEDVEQTTTEEPTTPPADVSQYKAVLAAQQLPIDKQEAFQRFAMNLPMNIHHVAAVAGISIHGVANAVHRGRLRRRSMQAEAGFHPDDVRAWVWG